MKKNVNRKKRNLIKKSCKSIPILESLKNPSPTFPVPADSKIGNRVKDFWLAKIIKSVHPKNRIPTITIK
jgi:hypothetical protein